MLKKIEKFEESLNKALGKALEALLRLLGKLWLKIMPQKLLEFIARIKASLASGASKTKAIALKPLVSVKQRVLAFKTKGLKPRAQDGALEEPKAPLKQKAMEQVSLLKAFLLKTPLKNRAENIARHLRAFLEKLFAIPRTQALIALSAMTMIFFGTYSVYVSGQKIYMSEWGSRAPASAEQYLERPNYLKFPARTLKVFNVKVPVYVENIKTAQSVTVDFTIRTDTRFAKLFLEEYEYKLKDHFFMTTEPVVSTFPLEEEGKWVLKDKIQDELNNFLRQEKVEGEVLEVDIIFIIGS